MTRLCTAANWGAIRRHPKAACLNDDQALGGGGPVQPGDERAPEGGALVPVSVLFADVRGYTRMAEQRSSVETTALLHRFYQAASVALLAHDAILGQIAGDEVMAIFVPGLAGSRFPRQAVHAAGALLRGVGYGTASGSWLEVGVGICTGE